MEKQGGVREVLQHSELSRQQSSSSSFVQIDAFLQDLKISVDCATG